MAYNGCTVIDMDAHIRERADKFFKDYIDPEYRAPFNLLCEAIARQEEKGERYALFGSTSAVIEKIEAGRALARIIQRGAMRPHDDTGGGVVFCGVGDAGIGV